MENVSCNKESIKLFNGIKYIVIDALYVNDIKQMIPNLNNENTLNEIRDKVFPYTDTPFAEYIPVNSILTLEQIKKIDYREIKSEYKNTLSTDCGMILFINEKILIDFASKYDYDDLVGSSTQLLSMDYWCSITSSYKLLDVAIIVSPGVGSGVDFDGSGSYQIW